MKAYLGLGSTVYLVFVVVVVVVCITTDTEYKIQDH